MNPDGAELEISRSPVDDTGKPNPGRTPEKPIRIPDFRGLSMAKALDVARRAGIELTIKGSGRGTGQSPGPGWGSAPITVEVRFGRGIR